MTAEDARLEAEMTREAYLLRLAYLCVKDAARTVGIIDGDSAKDSMIPVDLKAAMMRWASGIAITISRRSPSSPADSSPAGRPAASPKAGSESGDRQGGNTAVSRSTENCVSTPGPDAAANPVFGDTRTVEVRGGTKQEWYGGMCSKCGGPAWVRYPVRDPATVGAHTCLKCWQKERRR